MALKIQIHDGTVASGSTAAHLAAQILRETLNKNNSARLILATGISQFEMLKNLVREPGINWQNIQVFHLDEYLGITRDHPASFRRYLNDRFVSHLPINEFYEIQGDTGDPQTECRRLGELIKKAPVDLAMIGIGENGHIAFNDPPADFETNESYIIVDLDLACRKQQVGEGWYSSINDVPKQAITMSVKQIMQSCNIICTVSDERKAKAVKETVEGPISPFCPASILQAHGRVHLLLDQAAASLLSTFPN